MNCPKCLGLLEGPMWERTDQGYIYTIHCLNCGFRVNSCFVRELRSTDRKRFIKQQDHNKKLDLTKYDWGENDVDKKTSE